MRRYKRHGHNRSRKGPGRMAGRFADITRESGFYRSRHGLFMGVCKGLAQHFDFSVFWTRTLVLIAFLFTGFWPVGVLYIVAGLVLKAEPVSPLRTRQDEEFYDTYARSRESALQRVREKYENIERRIQRMEHTVTSRGFDWK